MEGTTTEERRLAVANFDELLAATTSVRVIEGSSAGGKRKDWTTLFIETDAPALAELRHALTLKPLEGDYAWMTPGDPTLILSDASGQLLAIQYLFVEFIRCYPLLPQDAELEYPGLLTEWLADRLDPES